MTRIIFKWWDFVNKVMDFSISWNEDASSDE